MEPPDGGVGGDFNAPDFLIGISFGGAHLPVRSYENIIEMLGDDGDRISFGKVVQHFD